MVDEMHIIRPPDYGHEHSVHCWCEPQVTRWRDKRLKKKVVLVLHLDLVFKNRADALNFRRTSPDYVTRFLNSIPTGARRRRKGNK